MDGNENWKDSNGAHLQMDGCDIIMGHDPSVSNGDHVKFYNMYTVRGPDWSDQYSKRTVEECTDGSCSEGGTGEVECAGECEYDVVGWICGGWWIFGGCGRDFVQFFDDGCVASDCDYSVFVGFGEGPA